MTTDSAESDCILFSVPYMGFNFFSLDLQAPSFELLPFISVLSVLWGTLFLLLESLLAFPSTSVLQHQHGGGAGGGV